MTFNSAQDLVKNVDKDHWPTVTTVDGTVTTWISILTLSFDFAPRRTLGLSNDGFWLTPFKNGDIRLIDTRDSCYYLLVCLQKSRNELENLLEESLLKNRLDVQIANTFPFTELIKMTLQTDTHWAENAAFWLQEKDMDDELETILTKFIDNKRFFQNARQHGFKILKRWQKHK